MEETDTELIVTQWCFKHDYMDGKPCIVALNNTTEDDRNVHRIQIIYNKDEQTYRCCNHIYNESWRLYARYVIDDTNVLFAKNNINKIDIKQIEWYAITGYIHVAKSYINRDCDTLIFKELEQLIVNGYEHPLVADWKLGLAFK